MAASGAPLHSYYLNFNMLDRYRKLGVTFRFNPETNSIDLVMEHYDPVFFTRDFPLAEGSYGPTDLAIVGFNNIELGGVLATPLTTVDYPVREVGDHAAHLLRTLIADPSAPWETKTFKPALIVRASA